MFLFCIFFLQIFTDNIEVDIRKYKKIKLNGKVIDLPKNIENGILRIHYPGYNKFKYFKNENNDLEIISDTNNILFKYEKSEILPLICFVVFIFSIGLIPYLLIIKRKKN
ncbi:hypothetical protein CWI38_1055p0010 [Hamiltosporidium tvaerminnensis]|uniref:Uncharacterized protein n=2 Tax=Hamiltosporidium TaxID=1176354 RepID=A0A4Q9LQZ9_9MICR|nr:hypothetical protein CWI36_0560p0020 [Hamiltosporidium magnivora]TBU10993.1 hypothetical protein CWI38_1443p0020 [Hamiltosporidium tvaerminnensis]TBU11747.1 hypothetical protein CWI38_1055p0010 [Hamiltosporidium tvaerminnensis]